MVREPRDDEGHKPNWGPRVLAPLAFFAAVTVLVLLVQSSLGGDPNSAANPTTTSISTVTIATGTAAGNPAKRINYRIKDGDTLEAIAQRFDTTVEDLVALNPDIEPNNLEPGTRIRIQ